MQAAEGDGPKPLRLGRTKILSSLKTSSLAAAPRAKQSRAACKVVSWLSCGVIFRGPAPLHEVLGCISRAALVHNIIDFIFLCWIACRTAARRPGGVGFRENQIGRSAKVV
ncbi:hypothetical protein ETH_00010505 [Eimeria tenella]|uniref:Uncharacterized protein n=1 Tax=Eimeria tenella TaxID=5802 RepID=U6KZC5_EIMTE|nr:hypothetical protein ETH_00010505 [Eimeria tenella]CDJ41679.1 hypothetical protein ETH_00010505 [Eimeria tenella]|eukprot:XP_013232429.1 hypothetical protein ETH_00010505 [Eimeria tenella]